MEGRLAQGEAKRHEGAPRMGDDDGALDAQDREDFRQ